jgi:thiol-disulfide isomerase/thioredoxin
MNKLLLFFAILLFSSFINIHEIDNDRDERIIISGKISDFISDKSDVEVLVYRLGFDPEKIKAKIDGSGCFTVSFKSVIPTDVRLTYNTGIFVLTHPGDSIFIEIDGKFENRRGILRTVKFSGDGAKTNQDAASFQDMYVSSSLYLNSNAKNKAIKDYDVDEFICYLDTIQTKICELMNNFSNKFSPNEETKKWAQLFIEQQEYFDPLCFYPMEHQKYNNLKSSDWSLPSSYFDLYLKRLPISDSMFISTFALNNFVNRYSSFISNKINEENENYVIKGDYVYFVAPKEIADSISVYSIIKHTKDPLLRQLSLVELFERRFKKSEVGLLESFSHLVDSIITIPYLKDPLLVHYNQIKANLEDPRLTSRTILKRLDDSSGKQVMDSLRMLNKGKVVYVNCWATWCGPCKAEMPYSKQLSKDMADKDVTFVYMCLDSEEKQWKATLSDLQLNGQHYFLSEDQSTDFRKAFEIVGIPFYFLIDRKGTIIEKGSHLRPSNVKEKIEILLNE